MMLIATVLAASALLAVCTALEPIYLTRATDACGRMDAQAAVRYFLIFVLCIVGILVFEAVRQILSGYYAAKKTEQLKGDVLKNILNMSIETFAGENAQNYVTMLNNEIDMLVNQFYIERMNFIYSILVLVTSLTALISINPVLAVLIVVTTLTPIISSSLCGGRISLRTNMYTESLRRFNVAVGNLISGYPTIKVNKISNAYGEILASHNKETASKKFRASKTEAMINMLIGSLAYLGNILLVGVSIYMILHGKLTFGAMLGAIQISEMLAIPTNSVAYQLNNMASVKSIRMNIGQMAEDFRKKCQNDDKAPTPGEKIQTIEFKDVTFKYGEKLILNHISLKFEAGKKYMILGENGSGKSTLFKLMSRFATNYEGEILINGRELKTLSDDYYNHVGIVLQTPFMFNDTLLNNISLYHNDDESCVMAVLRTLELENFLKHHSLTDVYRDTEDNLSGGEKQKLALARVLLRQKEFILLDEATAAVDAASSYVIEKALLENEKLAVINIEHKLIEELMPYYDVIYRLENGRLQKIN